MRINPCKEERLKSVLILPFFVACSVYICSLWEWNRLSVAVYAFLICIATIESVKNYIYWGRTIFLDPMGCEFLLLGFRKFYKWGELNVQFCANKSHFSLYCDVSGPGIIICKNTLKVPATKFTPSFCRVHYPFSSVFIRFRSKADEKRNTWEAPRSATYGYVVEKEEILGYLKSIGVL